MKPSEIAAALDAAVESLADSPPERRPGGRPRSADSWGDAFHSQAVAMAGGHLHWTGRTGSRGTPVVAWAGQVETAYRLAFRWHHKREPQGNVRPECGYPACVAGAHLADLLIREGGGV